MGDRTREEDEVSKNSDSSFAPPASEFATLLVWEVGISVVGVGWFEDDAPLLSGSLFKGGSGPFAPERGPSFGWWSVSSTSDAIQP